MVLGVGGVDGELLRDNINLKLEVGFVICSVAVRVFLSRVLRQYCLERFVICLGVGVPTAPLRLGR